MLEEKSWLHAFASCRPFVSAEKLRHLFDAAGSWQQAWNAPDDTLRSAMWTDDQRQRFAELRRSWNVDRAYADLAAQGIVLVAEKDPSFPALLKQIYDPPIALYARGDLWHEETAIAVVGSRKATPYGKTATHLLTRPLAARGITIVSGLAYGIDAEAHRAALGVHGRTIAVLGSGVDQSSLYPRAHRALADEIIAKGGVVLSEYAPGARPQGYFFPQRNRIISGLSRAVIVVEADEHSGALITAKAALDQNRDVFAVPGPITSDLSRGPHGLIRDGATPACCAEDILEALEFENLLPLAGPRELPTAEPPRHEENSGLVLQLLSTAPRTIDELVQHSKLPPNVIASLLTILEIHGRVRDLGGKQYVKL